MVDVRSVLPPVHSVNYVTDDKKHRVIGEVDSILGKNR